jgi:hypothetical protein
LPERKNVESQYVTMIHGRVSILRFPSLKLNCLIYS